MFALCAIILHRVGSQSQFFLGVVSFVVYLSFAKWGGWGAIFVTVVVQFDVHLSFIVRGERGVILSLCAIRLNFCTQWYYYFVAYVKRARKLESFKLFVIIGEASIVYESKTFTTPKYLVLVTCISMFTSRGAILIKRPICQNLACKNSLHPIIWATTQNKHASKRAFELDMWDTHHPVNEVWPLKKRHMNFKLANSNPHTCVS